jgi:hypothetical protein
MIRRDQWEEQDDLGDHTDSVGTISLELTDMIWEAKCKANRHVRNIANLQHFNSGFWGTRESSWWITTFRA